MRKESEVEAGESERLLVLGCGNQVLCTSMCPYSTPYMDREKE